MLSKENVYMFYQVHANKLPPMLDYDVQESIYRDKDGCERVPLSCAFASCACGNSVTSPQETRPASKLQRPIRGGTSARMHMTPPNHLQQVTNVGSDMVLGKMSGKVTLQ